MADAGQMGDQMKRTIYLYMSGIVCVVDLLGKVYAENMPLPECGWRRLSAGGLILRRCHNEGAAFNIGESRRSLVCIVSVLLTIVSGGMLLISLGQRGNGMLRLGLSLVLGGAFSNTYDRLKRKYVVDYISFDVKWKPFRNIVFNLADFAIITGALFTAFGAAMQRA